MRSYWAASPSLFVSELSSNCPSSPLSGSLTSSSSSAENIFTSLSVISSNTLKFSASSTILRDARNVDAVISTSTEPSGTFQFESTRPISIFLLGSLSYRYRYAYYVISLRQATESSCFVLTTD